MNDVAKISNHIPESILRTHKNVERMVKVFQGMQDVREEAIERYIRSFYFPMVTDIQTIRKYVDEFGGEYLEENGVKSLVCLYTNFHYIYSRKGTIPGLKRLLECLFLKTGTPIVEVQEFSEGLPIILSDGDRFYDFIPNGADIAAEINPDGAEIKYAPTILGDWLITRQTLTLSVDVDYVPSENFINFIRETIVKYVPMTTAGNLILTLNIL